MARQALAQLGLTLKDLNPADLISTFKKLADAGLNTGQALAIFGQRGGRAAAALTSNADLFKEFYEDTLNAGGAAKKAADIINDNMIGAFNRMKSAVENVAIAIGSGGLLQGLTKLFDGIASTARFVAGLIEQFDKIPGAAKLAAGYVTQFGAVLLALGGTIAVIGAVTKALGVLRAAAVSNPYILLASVIAGAAFALYSMRDSTITLGNTTATVGEFIQATWETIVQQVTAYIDLIHSRIDRIAHDLDTIWSDNDLGHVAQALGDLDQATSVKAGEAGKSIGDTFADNLQKAIAAHKDAIAQATDTFLPGNGAAQGDPISRTGDSFSKSLQEEIDKLKAQQNAIGLVGDALDRYTKAEEIASKAAAAGIVDVQGAVDKYLEAYDALHKAQDAYEANPLNGLAAGFAQFSGDAKKLADSVAGAWKTALDGVGDQLADLVVDGKADFKSLLDNFAKQALSAGFKKLMADAFKATGLDNLFGSQNAPATSLPSVIAAQQAIVNAQSVNVQGLGTIPVTSANLPALASGGGGIGTSSWAAPYLAAVGRFNQDRPDLNLSFMSNSPAIDGAAQALAASVIKKFEGFSSTAYWDKDHYRVGFGSDTTTNAATGAVSETLQSTTTDMVNAGADLARRTAELQQSITKQLGSLTWNGIGTNARAGLMDVAYNYGKLPDSVVDAAHSGNIEELAQAVRDLKANPDRRSADASLILGDTNALVQQYQATVQQLQAIQQQGDQSQIAQATNLQQQIRAAVATGNQSQIDDALAAAQKFDQLNISVTNAGNSAAGAAPQIATVGTASQTTAPQVQQMGFNLGNLAAPLTQLIPGLGQFSGLVSSVLGSVLSGIHHSGGVAGSASAYRSMPAMAFAAARRYHTGGPVLGRDEVPAILQTGERVLNRQETAAYEAGRQAGGSNSRGGSINFGSMSIEVHSPPSSGSKEQDAAMAKETGRQVGVQVRKMVLEEMTQQMRPGGLLYGR